LDNALLQQPAKHFHTVNQRQRAAQNDVRAIGNGRLQRAAPRNEHDRCTYTAEQERQQ